MRVTKDPNVVKDPLNQMKAAKNPLNEMKAAKDPLDEMKAAKNPLNQMKAAKNPLDEMRGAKNPLNEMRAAKNPLSEMKAAKNPLDEMRAAKNPLDEMRAAKNPLDEVTSARGVTEDSIFSETLFKETGEPKRITGQMKAADDSVSMTKPSVEKDALIDPLMYFQPILSQAVPRRNLEPPAQSPSDRSVNPSEDGGNGFQMLKSTLNSATSTVSRYAQNAVRLMSQASLEGTSRFEDRVDRVKVEALIGSDSPRRIPLELVKSFHALPFNVPLATQAPHSLFELWDCETIIDVLPSCTLLADVWLGPERDAQTPVTAQVSGKLLVTSHRLSLEPIYSSSEDDLGLHYLVKTGLISLPYRTIVSPAGLQLNADSKDVLIIPPAQTVQPLSWFIDITLKSQFALALFIRTGDQASLDIHKLFALIVKQVETFNVLDFRPKAPPNRRQPFAAFDPEKEYARFVDPENCWRDENEHFGLCSSYPDKLPIPVSLNTEALESIARFRSKRRLPVLSWRSSKASLWRCSQPQSAFANCPADEYLICSCLHELQGAFSSRVIIFDARPFVNAVACKLTGAGYEDVKQSYPMCKIDFASIENIHRVSESQAALCRALLSSIKVTEIATTAEKECIPVPGSGGSVGVIQTKVWASGWLDHAAALLKAAARIARHLNSSESVLVHCSDGWDRTSQLTALACLLVDPFYRSIIGFLTLIEKEFSWLGHRFATRLGHRKCHSESLTPLPDASQESPVFVQWLECVYNLMVQFPDEFEFDEKLLLSLALHAEAGIFGDFSFDTQKDRIEFWSEKFAWESLFEQIQRRSTSYKVREASENQKMLPLVVTPFTLQLWTSYWLRLGCETLSWN